MRHRCLLQQSYAAIGDGGICLTKAKFSPIITSFYKRGPGRLQKLFIYLPLFSYLSVMGNLLYIIAVILVIIWAVSFFGGFYTGGIVHTLLVIAIIAILLRVISGRSAI